jgi:hypothetical protein
LTDRSTRARASFAMKLYDDVIRVV